VSVVWRVGMAEAERRAVVVAVRRVAGRGEGG